jgi:hypothetical protein
MKLPSWVRPFSAVPLAALLYVFVASPAINAAEPGLDPAGTWQVTYFYDGQPIAYQPVLKLAREGGKLTGTITRNTGGKIETLPIEDADLQDGNLTFKASFFSQVFKAGVLQPPDTNYLSRWKFQGKIAGNTIKGTIEKVSPGGVRTQAWEAKLGQD